MKAARKLRGSQHPRSLLNCVAEFLTPQVWKQARQAVPGRRSLPRWDLQPLVLVLLAMTWAAGDSQEERWQAARGFYVACHEARRRPGKTVRGFQKALARLPLRQLRALAQGVRDQIVRRYGERMTIDGFVPMGCDGSRVECPRDVELEARLGQAGKKDSAPTIWLTAFVHLGLGLLWSWRLGKGTADERVHLRQMLELLPPNALIVADAAYMGYDLARQILAGGFSFLWRLSSRVNLYTLEEKPLDEWDEGVVYYWPKHAQEKGLPPVTCRLIRIRARKKKDDVWLLTDVLDSTRLPLASASQFYRWRWRNEGIFRTYKRTVNKLKLSSRTVRLIHREAEGTLLALQVLLAHADLMLRREGTEGRPVISPRKVLLEIRKEITGNTGRRTPNYAKRLEQCRAETRQQKSPKASREWPRRKPHKSPAPPNILTLSSELKALLIKHIQCP